ncbi:MAG: cytochrome P450, partial [Myxococcota bacterium]
MANPKYQPVARLDALRDREPERATLGGVELVVLRVGGEVSVFQGACPHQGTSLSTGSVSGTTLTCASHAWCFDTRTGERVDRPGKCLQRFECQVQDGAVLVDACEVAQWADRTRRPSPHAPAGGTRTIASLDGPPPLPLLGNALSMRPGRLNASLGEWAARYGRAFKLTIPPKTTAVAFSDPTTLRTLLKDRPATFRRISSLAPVVKEAGGHGLFSQEGDEWRRSRRLTMPAFNMAQLRSFHGTMNKVLGRLQARWRKAAADGTTLVVQDEMTRFTVDITTILAFGHDLNTIEDQGGGIRDDLGVILPRVSARLLFPIPYWRYVRLPRDRAFDRARGRVQALVLDLVERARHRMRGKEPHEATTFLESLVLARDEGGGRLADEEIFGQVLTMLLAGEDTTAHTLSWIVHYMTEHPSVQAPMGAEAREVLDGPFAAQITDYEQLHYIHGVAMEAMRLRPVAPIIFLEATTDVEVEGIALPKGTMLILLSSQAGLADENFADAHRFDPQRWIDPEGRVHRPEVLLPFGFGPRHCPGRSLAMTEIHSVLAMLAADFRVAKVDGHPPVEEVFGFVLTASPMRVRLTATASA